MPSSPEISIASAGATASESAHWILLANLAATLMMVGLIWFVQIVHYPLFGRVGTEGFTLYEQYHQRLTTWVVAPPMCVELATAIALVWFRPPGVSDTAVWLGLTLVLAIWLLTACVQVPQHATLAAAFDPVVHQRLVVGNWLRTAAWTIRGALGLGMVSSSMGANLQRWAS